MTDRNIKLSDLKALKPLSIRAAESQAQLLEQMSKTSFGGRELGEAFTVLQAMTRDPGCIIVVTISGAMSVAKQSPVLLEMVEAGLVDIIVSTGAFLVHEMAQALGGTHYAHDGRISDQDLLEAGFNRVYDSLELDDSLTRVDELVAKVTRDLGHSEPISSFCLHEALGKRLLTLGFESSVLVAASQKGIPIYTPAFTDSGIGLAVAAEAIRHSNSINDESDLLDGVPAFNPFLDLLDYTRRVLTAKSLGILTIGGGVPRNWAQQPGPFIETINHFSGFKFKSPKFRYGVRICPEPAHWGGLSGCTYSEGITWGKFIPPEEGGLFAEVHCDATIAWPILVRAILETVPIRNRITK